MVVQLKTSTSASFEKMEQLIVYNIILAYSNFELPFEIDISASGYYLSVVIIHNNRSIVFSKNIVMSNRHMLSLKRSFLI